jgi:hypothetical protein
MRLPPPHPLVRGTMRTDDTLGQGMDAALVIAAFFGIGFGLDRWLGTAPWLLITSTMLAAVGVFVSWKARYSARMDALQAQRRDDSTRHRRGAGSETMMEP